MPDVIRVGTRGSLLARTQTEWVLEQLRQAHPSVTFEAVIIRTRGDRIQDRPLAEVGGKGLFTAELEAALLDGSIDFAVHSLKDLPAEDAPGLVLSAFPLRADARDTLAGLSLAELPLGATIGTGSLRREAQILQLRPDLVTKGIRGNVDTRLRKLDEGQYDAILLAMAGLRRLGIDRPDLHPLTVDQMVPAVGQGALAVQSRAGDQGVLTLLASIDHADTRRRVEAERAFLTAYGGGCNVPAACHALLEGDGIRLIAVATDAQGVLVRLERRGADGEALGRELAAALR